MAKAGKKEAEGKRGIQKQKKISKEVYIIGIGASAGGLKALSSLFSSVPNDTVSYVIVQHLSSEHRSFLKELLEPHSVLEIEEARHNMVVDPNKVYIIPNNKELTIKKNQLQLSEKQQPERSRTIDTFFKSLAEDKGHRAVGIILSGTGTDGSEGVVAIKKAGGMVIVQDPETAKFDGMPRNAISTGHVDFVLEPEAMPNEIFNYVKVSPIASEVAELVKSDNESSFFLILDMIRDRMGIDFSNYKRPTIIRRISRRMAICNINSLVDYIDYLNMHAEEIEILSKEFLIGVTKFFRDKEAYLALEQEVIPMMIDGKGKADQLRIWVAGCSTGEEAYSLAILIREYMNKVKKELEVKIFASDIDRDALEVAGKGLYSKRSMSDVSEKRLQEHFVQEDGKYRVNQRIRRMVIFAPHNVINDPPFSKVDLVSCRNMLIYLNPLLQKKVIDKFHYALRVGGFMFLGSSESIGDLKSFIDINKKWKIFRNIEAAYSLGMDYFGTHNSGIRKSSPNVRGIPRDLSSKQHMYQNFAELLNETLLEEYGYAAVYIDEQYDIVHGIGRFKRYMDLPEQNFTFNLLKLVPQSIASNLGTLLRKAVRDNKKVVAHNLQLRESNPQRFINVVVHPGLNDNKLMQRVILVLFSETTLKTEFRVTPPPFFENYQSESRVQELELELEHTKEDLQAVVEELETANEELQSTNEELLSSNEELQSTNEELQSLNEELHTINTEHQYKIKALVELDDDLNNYFRSTDIGQIFVDKTLVIRKFTPAASRLINLIESDIGRSIYQISNNLRYENLIDDIKYVIMKNSIIEKEIQDIDNIWYQMRVLPYITQERKIDGAIIIFIKIHELKNLHLMQAGILNSSPNAIIALKAVRNEMHAIIDFKVNVANRKAQELFNRTGQEISGISLWKEWPELQEQGTFERMVHVVKTGEMMDVEQLHQYQEQQFWLHIVAVKFDDGLVLTLHDITDRRLYEQELKSQQEENRLNAERFRTLLEAVPQITWTNMPTGESQTFNGTWYNYTGFSNEDSIGYGWTNAIHPDDQGNFLKNYEDSLKSGNVLNTQARILRRADNEYRWHIIKNVPLRNEDGFDSLWIGTATDIQDFKDAEEANIQLRLSQHRELLKAVLEAQETERKNISEALHNGLGQVLYASKLNLNEFKPKTKQDQVTLDKVDTLLKESIQITRNISFELTPSILKDFGLQAALKEMVKRFSTPNLKIELKINGFDKSTDSFVELSLYRIIQELLNNVIKHAEATQASINLSCKGKNVKMVLKDNGIGLNTKNLKSLKDMKGIGLRSIHHRLELLNGNLEVISDKDKGTTFILTCIL
jgi:two-component system, chemotaxis family, CheB/CheR fusion protein